MTRTPKSTVTWCAVNVDMIGKVRRNEDSGPEGSAEI